MRYLNLLLASLLLMLQTELWLGEGAARELHQLQNSVEEQGALNESLQQRNSVLRAEVDDLHQGLKAIETRARLELGMVGPDETFIQILPPGHSPDSP